MTLRAKSTGLYLTQKELIIIRDALEAAGEGLRGNLHIKEWAELYYTQQRIKDTISSKLGSF